MRSEAGLRRPFRADLQGPAFLEERAELYRATGYLLDEGSELEDGQLKALQTARTKIEYTVPDLADRLKQGHEQEPQMDM